MRNGHTTRRPVYWSGSLRASSSWRRKTWRVAPKALRAAAARPRATASPVAEGSSPAAAALAPLSAHLSSTFATASADDVSLDTRSSTASAGLAPLLSGIAIDSKYGAIAVRSPQKAVRPSESTRTLWKPENTSAEGWWMVHRTAAELRVAMVESSFMTAAAAAESSPEVGSSRMMTLGSLTSATARARRRRCPPDKPLKRKPPALVSWAEAMPVTARSWSTARSRLWASSCGLKSEKAKSMCSRAVSVGQRLSSRGT
mmetsp:Transcript_24758/g.80941  ORF Transcript_24758/g.80941 Transcript_24758/m.80941 type:complete len:258 (-) Transcript_24758:2456-3229(-)